MEDARQFQRAWLQASVSWLSANCRCLYRELAVLCAGSMTRRLFVVTGFTSAPENGASV